MLQYNDPKFKARRKKLRNNMTRAEIHLWSFLKDSQLEGMKFRRQYGVGPYILDFYNPTNRLAIELDGSSHDSEKACFYDQERTDYLNGLDIKVLRFENQAVFEQIDWVLDEIRKTASLHRPLPPPVRLAPI
ncbi:MAG: endonuclease domain-containing protein [Patescibacteria group bacterium]